LAAEGAFFLPALPVCRQEMSVLCFLPCGVALTQLALLHRGGGRFCWLKIQSQLDFFYQRFFMLLTAVHRMQRHPCGKRMIQSCLIDLFSVASLNGGEVSATPNRRVCLYSKAELWKVCPVVIYSFFPAVL